MKKVLLLSLLLLSQLSFGQDSLRIEYDKLTNKIDSLRTVKRNYEDKYSRYFKLKELLKDVNSRLEDHTTLPRGYSVQDLKTYRSKYLTELKTVKSPTDEELKDYNSVRPRTIILTNRINYENSRQQLQEEKELLIQIEERKDKLEQHIQQERIKKSRKQNKEKVFKPIIDIERYEI